MSSAFRGRAQSARETAVVRLRVFHLVCIAAAALAAPPSASAQSFFEALFGLGAPKPTPIAPVARVITVPSAFSRDRDPSVATSRTRGPENERGGETVQTICVRTCDGYFWPIRYPAGRADFARDARICQATCGVETKLYTRPGPGTEPEEMRTTDGSSYGASSTAFAYRKGLSNGCACRPMPWSDAERARHEGYVLAEAETKLRIAEAEAAKAGAVKAGASQVAIRAPSQAVAGLAAPKSAPLPAPSASSAAPLSAAALPAAASPVDRPVPPPGPAESAAIANALRVASLNEVAEGPPAVTAPPVPISPPDASPPPAPSTKADKPKSKSLDRPAPSQPSSQPPSLSPGRTRLAERAAPQPRVKVAASQPQPGVSFFGGPAKFTYPGDAPTRR